MVSPPPSDGAWDSLLTNETAAALEAELTQNEASLASVERKQAGRWTPESRSKYHQINEALSAILARLYLANRL